MATLYVDRKFVEMQSVRRTLQLVDSEGQKQILPLKQIDRIVLHGKVSTDTGTLGMLTDAGINITMLTGRFGRRQASVTGAYGKDVQRRVAQYQAYLDRHKSLEIATCLIKRKLAGQQRLLNLARQQRPDQRHALSKGIQSIRQIRSKLEQPVASIEILRGYEGAAAAGYFEAYRSVFADSLGFEGRKRRPPPDPVNSVLSLAYTLLHSDAVKTLHSTGLDPYLGYLHEPAHGRESLAADIIEPLRPKVDSMVWEMFRERRLVAAHFTIRDDGCLLGKTGRAIFYSQYEQNAKPMRRWLRLFCHALIGKLVDAVN